MSRRKVETLDRVLVLYRPFRRITFTMSTNDTSTGVTKTSTSLIDEDFASISKDPDHMLLLWRPRMASLIESVEENDKPDPYPGNQEAVNRVIDELVQLRQRGQEEDDELRPHLRSLQADPLSSVSFLIPRSPGGIRREEEILENRRETHAYVLAASLVTNSALNDRIESKEIGERIFIETIVAEFKDLKSGKSRIVLIETPGSKTMNEAEKTSSALNRLCSLYDECYNRILDSFIA
ncbi:MAG: hypothetical protein ACFFCP_04045 [Promethearchaeota archaeon]